MSTPKSIDGIEEKGGIPPESRVQVVILPKHTRVFDEIVDGPFHINLDPGKYRVGVRWVRPNGPGGIKYCYNFLHEVTEEEFILLRGVQPTRANVRMTTKGPRYTCGFGVCRASYGTALAMAIHEAEDHLGIDKKTLVDPSKDPVLRMELAARKVSKVDKTVEPPKPNLAAEEFKHKARKVARGG